MSGEDFTEKWQAKWETLWPKLAARDPDFVEPVLDAMAGSDPEAAPDTGPRLNLRQAKEVRGREVPPMLVEGVLPPGALFQIWGQTGTYKTFVIVDFLCSIANGIDWMGHRVNADDGLVALVLGEGGWDAGQRLDAWLMTHPDQSDELVAYSVEEGLDLMDQQQVSRMIDDFLAWQESNPGKAWRCIIFDTQADHMPNGNEDAAGDFTIIKRSIQRIAKATGAAVGLVHHTGWDDGRERGSSRQRQALDVVMQVKDQRIINVKQKFAPKFDPIEFVTEAVVGSGSIYVRQATPGEAMGAAASKATEGADEALCRKAVAALVDDPTVSANRMKKQVLNVGNETWVQIRTWLHTHGYIDLSITDGKVTAMKATDTGAEWLQLNDEENQ